MQIRNSIYFLAAVTMVSTVAACGGNHAQRESTYSTTAVVEWDSRPLDQNYRREHGAMESRHRDEMSHARADEAANARDARQAEETRDLEDRYRRGKEGHMKDLPPSDHHGDHH
jgi:septal ring factor EnvC (AmiA/AmiB activator)